MFDDVDRFIGEAYKIPAASSQIFDSITDLDLAYKQTLVASSLRDVIGKERTAGLYYSDCQAKPYNLIPFENCVFYYLAGASEINDRFLQFTFSHMLLQKIRSEDEENGTHVLELFWKYLSCGRNATLVANAMNVHRNTVLYHIEKIEKRFDLDLSVKEVRDKMVIDFKVLLLMENNVSL